MTDPEKVKAIEYLIHDVYMIEHNKRLAIFLAAYGENIRKSTILSMQIGIPIAQAPLMFDLRIPTEQLIQNLANFEVLHRKDDKPQ